LPDVIAHARENAPAVVEASGSIATARAHGVGASVSSFGNPYLEVVADHGQYTKDVQVLGQLFLPVDMHGQRSARIGEADHLLAWRQLGRAEAQGRAMAEAVAAYGDALVWSANVANALSQESEARTEAHWFAARAAARDATAVEVSLAEAEVSRYVQARAEAQLRLNDARARLVALTGLDLDASPPAGQRPEPPALRTSASAAGRSAARGELPAMRALAAESAYWGAFRERASAEVSQPVYLLVYGGRGEFAEARYGGGFAVTFPVARRSQGEMARADAERVRAANMQGAVRRVAAARLQGAFAAYEVALAAARELDTAGIPAAESTVRATYESFREGKTELVRVIIARRDLAAIRARRLELLGAGWRAYAEMTAVLGVLP
jgi:cobalt-zinc-cadmium efflux system outer membrane protein